MAIINGIEINLKPTLGMQEEAARFLRWRRDGHKGTVDT